MDKMEALVVFVISSSSGVSMPEDSMTGIEDVESGIDSSRHSEGIDSAWVFRLSPAVTLHAGSPMSPMRGSVVSSKPTFFLNYFGRASKSGTKVGASSYLERATTIPDLIVLIHGRVVQSYFRSIYSLIAVLRCGTSPAKKINTQSSQRSTLCIILQQVVISQDM